MLLPSYSLKAPARYPLEKKNVLPRLESLRVISILLGRMAYLTNSHCYINALPSKSFLSGQEVKYKRTVHPVTCIRSKRVGQIEGTVRSLSFLRIITPWQDKPRSGHIQSYSTSI